MNKIIKILLGVIGLLLVIGIVLWAVNNEQEPEGTDPTTADNLTKKMLLAVNAEAWDSTRFISWSFRGATHYLWDKMDKEVIVQWDDYKVQLNTTNQKGKATLGGNNLTGEEAEDAIKKAWKSFCNDSFWLNPMVKAFDPGTTRTMVNLKDGRKGIKVHYHSGGVTPGDSYVWILDDNHLPIAWKMWVNILPLGGLETSWDGWSTLSTGAKIATKHHMLGRDVDLISNVKAGMHWKELEYEQDPF